MMFFGPFISWLVTLVTSLISWMASVFGKNIAVAAVVVY